MSISKSGSPYLTGSKLGSEDGCAAPRSVPSKLYVQPWKGQVIADLQVPASAANTLDPRCLHKLWNALTFPSAPLITSARSPIRSHVTKSPLLGMSLLWQISCQWRLKNRSFSASNISLLKKLQAGKPERSQSLGIFECSLLNAYTFLKKS